MSWTTLGNVAPTDLVGARLELHHAAQVVASAANTLLEPQPDDSHPNLGWVDAIGALLGRQLPGGGAQVGLRIADLSLVIAQGEGSADPQVCEEIHLDGKTLEVAYAWLAAAAGRAGALLPDAGIRRVAYEIPSRATGDGAPFSAASQGAFAELSHWFANGQLALSELVTGTPGASELRVWPHHFDLGALIVVETDADGQLAKSIGVGFSPGDEGYAEPYWYVSPWPYPDADALPELEGGGHWHTSGHTSAILTGSELLKEPAESQSDRLHTFLNSALKASQQILAG